METCKECVFYNAREYYDTQCRRRSPIGGDRSIPSAPVFPPTFADGWCGEFEGKTPTPTERKE